MNFRGVFFYFILFFLTNNLLNGVDCKYKSFDVSIDFVYSNATKFIKIISRQNLTDVLSVDKNNPMQVIFDDLKKDVDLLLELKVAIKNGFNSKSFKEAISQIEELRLLKNNLDKLCDLNRLNKNLQTLTIKDPVERAVVFLKSFSDEVEQYKQFVVSNFFKQKVSKLSLEEIDKLIGDVQSFCLIMNSILDKTIILLNSDFSKNVIEFLNKWIVISGFFPDKLGFAIGGSIVFFTILAVTIFLSLKIWSSRKNIDKKDGEDKDKSQGARTNLTNSVDIDEEVLSIPPVGRGEGGALPYLAPGVSQASLNRPLRGLKGAPLAPSFHRTLSFAANSSQFCASTSAFSESGISPISPCSEPLDGLREPADPVENEHAAPQTRPLGELRGGALRPILEVLIPQEASSSLPALTPEGGSEGEGGSEVEGGSEGHLLNDVSEELRRPDSCPGSFSRKALRRMWQQAFFPIEPDRGQQAPASPGDGLTS